VIFFGLSNLREIETVFASLQFGSIDIFQESEVKSIGKSCQALATVTIKGMRHYMHYTPPKLRKN
jgi:hypothetical protein